MVASNANIGGALQQLPWQLLRAGIELDRPIILAGILGYVIGNYLGIFMGNFLQLHLKEGTSCAFKI